MSKSYKLLIFISISLAAVFAFHTRTSDFSSPKETRDEALNIYENTSIEAEKSSKNYPEKNEGKLSALENNSKYEIDLQLSKDLAITLMIKDIDTKISEIIRLADEHPENSLLQYLAATNCLNKKQDLCDTEKFSQRLLINDPTNATAKSFLAAMYLKNNDSESALAELLKINADDTYSTFFYDITQSLEPAYNEKLNDRYSLAVDQLLPLIKANENYNPEEYDFNEILNNAIQAALIGVAAAQVVNFDSPIACEKNLKNNTAQQRWMTPCMNLANTMITSDTIIIQSLGYAIQENVFALQNNETNLIQVQNLQNERVLIYEAAGKLLSNEAFLLSSNFNLYYQESIVFGEYQAMKNLLEREGI